MSWRKSSSLHPAKKTPQAASKIPRVSEALIFIAHLGHKFSTDAFKEFRRGAQVEFFVAGLNADEEFVICGALETRHREKRAMRLRQFVQRQHSEHGKRRSAENGQFERDWNERRPAIQWTAGDIQRIRDHIHPILKEETP